jgi:iron-sulfur cluster insertion protein
MSENENIIEISPEAAQAVQKIMDEKNLHLLRVYVAGSSCHGAQFGIALDDHILETDTLAESENIKIIIDRQSLDYLRGAQIEYIDDPQKGTGFVIHAPQNANSCSGCGSGGNSCGSSGCDSCGH